MHIHITSTPTPSSELLDTSGCRRFFMILRIFDSHSPRSPKTVFDLSPQRVHQIGF